MTYKQAIEKMRELADGRDWCLSHETASYYYVGGVEITAYIKGYGHSQPAVIYADAIHNMEELMGIVKHPVPIPDAPPEDGDG